MFLSAWVGATLAFLNGTPRVPPHPVPDRNPVLIIHGIADSERNMQWMAAYLRQEGWEVHTINLKPNWGQQGLEVLARQIDVYANETFGKRKFNLVGFSMGGLVSRYYVQRLGGLKKVDHLITLSAPHNGTAAANWSHLTANLGCQQMKPGSPFLTDLDRDADRLRTIKFTSVYTPYDLVILPARSSEMPQARNIAIPVVLHPLMVVDRRCLKVVAEALKA